MKTNLGKTLTLCIAIVCLVTSVGCANKNPTSTVSNETLQTHQSDNTTESFYDSNTSTDDVQITTSIDNEDTIADTSEDITSVTSNDTSENITSVTSSNDTSSAKEHIKIFDIGMAADCTENGLTDGIHCLICGEILVAQKEIPAKGHTPDTVATCTTAQTCTECNETIKAKLGHSMQTIAAKASTCKVQGNNAYYKCIRCNKCFKDKNGTTETTVADQTLPLGCAWNSGGITKQPTCTATGVKPYTCTACGKTKTETVAALGHDCSEKYQAIEGTLGIIKYTCNRCNIEYEEDVQPISLSIKNSGTSSVTFNGYGAFTKHYQIIVWGGYGTKSLKYEIFINSTATSPIDTIDFTTSTSYQISYKGYENAIDEYVLKITLQDSVGNTITYRIRMGDLSIIE